MKRIPVNNLAAGQKFTKPVYVDSTNILVGGNVPIKEADLQRLAKWDIKYVETDGELVKEQEAGGNKPLLQGYNTAFVKKEYENLLSKKEEFLRSYRHAVESVSSLFNDIKNGKTFNNNLARDIAESLIQDISETRNIFIFIPPVRVQGMDYLAPHSVNVTIYSLVMGFAHRFSKMRLSELGLGALLFDVGMLKIPKTIVEKEGKLTDDEMKIVHSHPIHGYKILTEYAKIKRNIANIALMHHENYDGSGYPRALRLHNIDEYARIVSITDHYVAQTRNRSYRDKLSANDSMKSLLSTGVNKFDPQLLRKFLSRFAIYPIGSLVRLNNSIIGMVIKSVEEKPLRPILKIVVDEFGEPCLQPRIINLLERNDLYIIRGVDETDIDFPVAEAF
jgi:HD-GYP domain-containing protein (c-di-GMP phosphodiesterase class II)